MTSRDVIDEADRLAGRDDQVVGGDDVVRRRRRRRRSGTPTTTAGRSTVTSLRVGGLVGEVEEREHRGAADAGEDEGGEDRPADLELEVAVDLRRAGVPSSSLRCRNCQARNSTPPWTSTNTTPAMMNTGLTRLSMVRASGPLGSSVSSGALSAQADSEHERPAGRSERRARQRRRAGGSSAFLRPRSWWWRARCRRGRAGWRPPSSSVAPRRCARLVVLDEPLAAGRRTPRRRRRRRRRTRRRTPATTLGDSLGLVAMSAPTARIERRPSTVATPTAPSSEAVEEDPGERERPRRR